MKGQELTDALKASLAGCGAIGQNGEFVCDSPAGHSGPHAQKTAFGHVAWTHSDQYKEWLLQDGGRA